MIRLGVLFPDHLNLNGDYGNIEVLARQFDWRGMECDVVRVEDEHQLADGLDFLLVGHGSSAAWDSIRDRLNALEGGLRDLVESGTPGLCVSTGFEELVRLAVIQGIECKSIPERVSKFVVHKDGAHEMLGYLNTDVDLPLLYREGQFVCTMLHGPVLAKNPALLLELLENISLHAGLQLKAIQTSEKADLLAGLVDEVWKLERDLASE
jgi:lipid II isoglutaminyl synthase (glutamine-hydrolysing)